MSDVEPSKSHTTRWIVGVVVAVVLYLGSYAPVNLLLYRHNLGVPGIISPRDWLDSRESDMRTFYRPAVWVWHQPILEKICEKWSYFWWNIIL